LNTVSKIRLATPEKKNRKTTIRGTEMTDDSWSGNTLTGISDFNSIPAQNFGLMMLNDSFYNGIESTTTKVTEPWGLVTTLETQNYEPSGGRSVEKAEPFGLATRGIKKRPRELLRRPSNG
jgi:hypothetical protein